MSDEYRGIHKAPGKDDDDAAPMYAVDRIYPDDIYSSNAARYYGDSYPTDSTVIALIHAVRGKPNAPVTIYRAVPDFHYDISAKIRELSAILVYKDRFGFFPMKNKIVHDLQDKYSNLEYDASQAAIIKDIEDTISKLEADKSNRQLTINDGDWVTISRAYAKMHGEGTLLGKYKILTKKVKAKNLYTDANSIYEWGYWS